MSEAAETTFHIRLSAPAQSCRSNTAARRSQHHTLMRAYQARYVILPPGRNHGSILRWLDERYDPQALAALEAHRPGLEEALIAPHVNAAIAANLSVDVADYTAALLQGLRQQSENAFTAFLRTTPHRGAHFRVFLLQSSADLLAEASATS